MTTSQFLFAELENRRQNGGTACHPYLPELPEELEEYSEFVMVMINIAHNPDILDGVINRTKPVRSMLDKIRMCKHLNWTDFQIARAVYQAASMIDTDRFAPDDDPCSGLALRALNIALIKCNLFAEERVQEIKNTEEGASDA